MSSSALPQVPGARVIRALEKAGFVAKRTSGNHVVLRHSVDLSRRAIVPLHGSKPVKQGTLHSILKGAGLSVAEFADLLK